MNLGLGVLEEQHSDDEDKREKSEGPKKDSESRSKESDSNVMDTLMGNDEEPSSKKPTIQEL
ncbi:hypothetical protein P170DRAFT_441120 [Aspergillus steynii IBT 23096]|uniref:Uncharacterized protein n=1 Tax=Aspergillus steynii IBT 23096 TaxID=1392250 RepID=A0A2I2FSQ1_9EURO|nr:uncharacterized protein P170DRAFT_441120 [Aspergillus steynii IBT 23096]PLB43663.1 hypothetical protein P170DRAFT_441120 [Aspergillus steynii IBT 23096]